MPITASKPRAIGIVRVSQTKGRGKTKGREESFVSPGDQRRRIEAECERAGLRLIRCEKDELDVSGGAPLAGRKGLLRAVEAIEAGEADTVVAAYFDRLVRSLDVQGQVVQRVEAAGGSVLAVDVGEVSEGTAGQWLSGTMLGAVSEYQRRTAKERNGHAQRDAVERGVAPWPNIPPGYVRGEDGVLIPHPVEVPAVAQAFQLRGDGKTIKEVRAHLKANGIERAHHGVQAMLKSRVYLGEIHFGKLVNLNAHEPIVDPDVWRRAQRTKLRGPREKSNQLLARQGVLRCGTCGARMSVGTQHQNGRTYPFYKCNPTSDCPNRMAIGAKIAEAVIVDRVRAALANVEGRASAEANVREAELAAEQAQQAFDAAIRAFDGFDEPSARERLLELRQTRDDANALVEQLGGGAPAALTINAATDWDLLNLDEKRGLIRSTVESATVAAGRGAERLTLKLFSEDTASCAV
jgi:DNA invertase Pin-like site-specific DNA recombinase